MRHEKDRCHVSLDPGASKAIREEAKKRHMTFSGYLNQIGWKLQAQQIEEKRVKNEYPEIEF